MKKRLMIGLAAGALVAGMVPGVAQAFYSPPVQLETICLNAEGGATSGPYVEPFWYAQQMDELTAALRDADFAYSYYERHCSESDAGVTITLLVNGAPDGPSATYFFG